MTSNYKINTFKKDIEKKVVCEKKMSPTDIEVFKFAIQENYYAEFYIEDIAAHDQIGRFDEESDTYYLKNHIDFNIYLDKYDNVII